MAFIEKRRNNFRLVSRSPNSDLKNANEELYKRNLELAVKNKTLSLLQQLYHIANQALIPKFLAHRLAKSIALGLELPFVGIFLLDSTTNYFYPLATASINNRYKNKNIDGNRDLHVKFTTRNNPKHIFSKSLKSGKLEKSHNLKTVLEPLLTFKMFDFFSKEIKINTILVYPLLVEKKKLGVLTVGLDKLYKELNIFEMDSINSLVNVVNVALDKAIVYEDLKTANARLRILDRQKTEFLSIASHQLRTPLSIIKGYTELIGDGAYGKITKKTKGILFNIDQSNERLVKLVDEFLNISRIEQGRTKYSFEKSQINDIIESVLAEITGRAENKGLKIDWKKNNKLGLVYMDEEKVRHIVFNYIDNAIKYSEKGTVTITTKIEDAGVTVKVQDEGYGFGPEDEAAFFHKFYRGKNVEGVHVNGTGLGIYVCKKFAEAHGGTVWAHSRGPGKGSEFGFWLPKKKTKQHQISEKSGNEKQQTLVNQYDREKI